MTPFRKLAIRISKNPNHYWGICGSIPRKETLYFIKHFEPTEMERKKYNHRYLYWMSEFGQPFHKNNDLRILALLICEQHYLTYNKS